MSAPPCGVQGVWVLMNEPKWCTLCNGYGSSLGGGSDRCTRCGGGGVAADTAGAGVGAGRKTRQARKAPRGGGAHRAGTGGTGTRRRTKAVGAAKAARGGGPVTPERGTHVVGYLRVSTTEQADSGLGLAAQRAAVETEASRRGWEIAAVLADE